MVDELVGGVELAACADRLLQRGVRKLKHYRLCRLLLTPTEFAVLELLMRFPNELFSPEAIIDRAWSSHSETSPENVRFYIRKIRQKLNDSDADPLIQNIWGKGYMLKKKTNGTEN